MLSISNISKDFRLNGAHLPVLRDISIDVNPGEVLVILGMSGCGKSSLLKIIAGLSPADSGTVVLDGKPVTTPTPEIGIVFQSYTVFPWMTVLKNIESGLKHSYIRSEERETRARKFLELVGLSEFAKAWPSTLSGGMQQRVALARTYAMNPKVLLMDEPFGALDSLTRRTMQREFMRIHSTEKKSTVFVTHDIDEALTVGDRIVVFSARPARIVAEFTNPNKELASESSEDRSRNAIKNEIGAIFMTFETIALIKSGQMPENIEEINKAEFIDAIRNQIVNDEELASSVLNLLKHWDDMTTSQRQFIANLMLGVITNNESYRERIFNFICEKFISENSSNLKIQLIFTAFHAGGGISDEFEDKLTIMIKWIGNHLKEFNSACEGYYGENDKAAINRLEQRLDNPLYRGAVPLYLLNLKSFSEYNIKGITNKYNSTDRKTIIEAIKIMSFN